MQPIPGVVGSEDRVEQDEAGVGCGCGAECGRHAERRPPGGRGAEDAKYPHAVKTKTQTILSSLTSGQKCVEK